MFILNANEPNDLATYLQKQLWLGLDEKILSLTKPGEGNMNYVLRVTTEHRTFIVKQSRAYVEKYPQVAAPEKRVLTEGAFYKKISSEESVQKFMPKVIGLDVDNNVMLIEDLGFSTDFTFLYDLEHPLQKRDLTELLQYLNTLHSSFEKTLIDDELANLDLRKLNHEHIFQYPFMAENGFDLDSVQNGLQELALAFKNNKELKKQISTLGEVYLSKGKYLLHGDYYPGSWLRTADGIKIIDPEFCYYGLREFDLGVLLAHLYLTQQDGDLIQVVIREYKAYGELDLKNLYGFIGVEMMRRLIGLAQLPLQMDLDAKKELLAFAQTLILN